jgi:hypothetical protein
MQHTSTTEPFRLAFEETHMKVKGMTAEALQSIAEELGLALFNRRWGEKPDQRGNFVHFTLRMGTRTAAAPDARYRKRGFSGRRGTAVCFHGHYEFFRKIFLENPAAVIVTCKRRWTSLSDLEENADAVGRQNAGSIMNPQSYDSQCDCA